MGFSPWKCCRRIRVASRDRNLGENVIELELGGSRNGCFIWVMESGAPIDGFRCRYAAQSCG